MRPPATVALRSARASARRRVTNAAMLALCALATALALAALAAILGYVLWHGLRHVDWAFFTRTPAPVGERGGGFANALVGSAIMVSLASAMSVPLGLLAGIYLAEYGRGAFARAVRFVNDALLATPSIVAGLVAYGLVVVPMRGFSALAGSVALALLMVPTVTRTTEDMLRLVPSALRDAALALGVPRWRATLGLTLRAAAPGIATGVLLAVARVSGETAALLFTAFNNRFLSTALDAPMASVPVQLYACSISPYEDWHRQAWAAALVLVALVALFSAAVRAATRRMRTDEPG